MRRNVAFALAMAATCAASEAHGADDSGFTAAARLAYGFPIGNVASDSSGTLRLGDDFSGEVPIWLDAGWRFHKSIFIGGYFQYGFALVNNGSAFQASTSGVAACTIAGVSCSGSEVRVGAEILYGFAPSSSWQPWAGLGFGYEWTNLHASGPGGEADVQYRGWEFLNIQAGVDFKIGDSFALGPFVAFSMGEYETIAVSATGQPTQDINIPSSSSSFHEWLQFGLKGTLNL